MKFVISIVLIALASLLQEGNSLHAAKPKRDIGNVKKEQQATKKEIAETSKKLTANTRETNKMLSRLNTLTAEAQSKREEVAKLQMSVDSVDKKIRILDDSIRRLDNRVESMRKNYAKSLRGMQGNFQQMSTLSFVFSSKSFAKAWQRVRYMQEMGKWRKRRSREIKSAVDSLTQRRVALDDLKSARRKSVALLSVSQKQLEDQKIETDKLVSRLQQEGSSLRALLKEKEKKAKALDNELDRLIAQEQKKAEEARKAAEKKRREEEERKKKEATDRSTQQTTDNNLALNSSTTGTTNSSSGKIASNKTTTTNINVADQNRILSGNFESNKGKLLFPVAGKYRIVRGFGRQKHPELAYVETDNSGIDIEAIGGGAARAVFAGTVSEIFRQPGYNTIVMVRHGNYLTIYANLSTINVKKGEELKSGQQIGTIYADPEENGASILHFELRKERNKLNPTEWVK